MGPPAFAGGNCLRRAARRAARARLQWGHRLSPVETWRQNSARRFLHWASMGPPAFAGGNRNNAELWLGYRSASMGPPAFAGGNSFAMRKFGRISASFNGATGFRRWKLGKL